MYVHVYVNEFNIYEQLFSKIKVNVYRWSSANTEMLFKSEHQSIN